MRACMCTQSCLTQWDPMDCSPSGSSVHGISLTKILDWVAIPSIRGSSWPRNRICGSCSPCTAGSFFTTEPLGKSPELFKNTLTKMLKWNKWNLVSCLFRKAKFVFGMMSCQVLDSHYHKIISTAFAGETHTKIRWISCFIFKQWTSKKIQNICW